MIISQLQILKQVTPLWTVYWALFRRGETMTTDEEMRDKIQQAIKTTETFSTIYYKKMDSERHNMDKLYLDTATLAWNGNPVDVRWTK